MTPRSDFRMWHVASYRYAAEFGRFRAIADLASGPPGENRS